MKLTDNDRSNLHRIVWTFLIFLVLSLFVGVLRYDFSIDKLVRASYWSQPYKAKSVEQCIKEEACVRYAFLKLINSGSVDGSVLSRWESDINIKIIGNDSPSYISEVQGAVDKISPLFPHTIRINDQSNFLIIFSDDFDRDMYQTYRKDFILLARSDKIFKAYEPMRGKNSKCIDMGFSDPQKKLRLSIVFISHDDAVRKSCIESQLFLSLGFGGWSSDFPFQTINDPHGVHALTALDMLLLRILYHPELHSGMPIGQVENMFSKIYKQIHT